MSKVKKTMDTVEEFNKTVGLFDSSVSGAMFFDGVLAGDGDAYIPAMTIKLASIGVELAKQIEKSGDRFTVLDDTIAIMQNMQNFNPDKLPKSEVEPQLWLSGVSCGILSGVAAEASVMFSVDIKKAEE